MLLSIDTLLPAIHGLKKGRTVGQARTLKVTGPNDSPRSTWREAFELPWIVLNLGYGQVPHAALREAPIFSAERVVVADSLQDLKPLIQEAVSIARDKEMGPSGFRELMDRLAPNVVTHKLPPKDRWDDWLDKVFESGLITRRTFHKATHALWVTSEEAEQLFKELPSNTDACYVNGEAFSVIDAINQELDPNTAVLTYSNPGQRCFRWDICMRATRGYGFHRIYFGLLLDGGVSLGSTSGELVQSVQINPPPQTVVCKGDDVVGQTVAWIGLWMDAINRSTKDLAPNADTATLSFSEGVGIDYRYQLPATRVVVVSSSDKPYSIDDMLAHGVKRGRTKADTSRALVQSVINQVNPEEMPNGELHAYAAEVRHGINQWRIPEGVTVEKFGHWKDVVRVMSRTAISGRYNPANDKREPDFDSAPNKILLLDWPF